MKNKKNNSGDREVAYKSAPIILMQFIYGTKKLIDTTQETTKSTQLLITDERKIKEISHPEYSILITSNLMQW